ncbi:MAG: NAD(P)H-dependent oxidoreductase [Beijerinckiaceae bacterium]
MRVLVLYAHPDPSSYGAALHAAVIEELKAAGHEVDDCDLYAEGFDPVLSRSERVGYHDLARNTEPVAGHVARLAGAEALVIVTPVWNFGWPAILKGYLDRVFLPGVSFRLAEGKVSGALTNIRRLTVVTTYGGTRWRALLVGDPPRRIVTRMLNGVTGFRARIGYLAHYDMNRSTAATRAAFLAKVRSHVAKLS